MASTNELIEKLESLSADYEDLINICIEYNDDTFFTEVPQPEIAQKADNELFDKADCKAFIKGNYEFEGKDEKKLQLAKYKKGVAPQEDWINTYPPDAPSFPEKVFSISLIIISLLVALSIFMFTLMLQGNGMFARAEEEATKAQAQSEQVQGLLLDEKYLEWKLIWNDAPTAQKLENGWTAVETEWEKSGVNISYETLNSIMQSVKDSKGQITLEATDKGLRDYLKKEYVSFDKDLVKIDIYGKYVVNKESVDFAIGLRKFGFGAVTVILGAFTMLRLLIKRESAFAVPLAKLVFYAFSMFVYAFVLVFFYLLKYPKLRKEKAEANKNYQEKWDAYQQQEALCENQYYADIANEAKKFDNIFREYQTNYKSNKKKLEERNRELEVSFNEITAKMKSYVEIPKKYLTIGQLDSVQESDIEELQEYVHSLIDILCEGRADTIKEAVKCLNADKKEQEEMRRREEQEEEEEILARKQAEEERLQQRRMARLMRESVEQEVNILANRKTICPSCCYHASCSGKIMGETHCPRYRRR